MKHLEIMRVKNGYVVKRTEINDETGLVINHDEVIQDGPKDSSTLLYYVSEFFGLFGAGKT